MGENPSATDWIVCPNCRARQQVVRGAAPGSQRCRNCAAPIGVNQGSPIDDDLELVPLPDDQLRSLHIPTAGDSANSLDDDANQLESPSDDEFGLTLPPATASTWVAEEPKEEYQLAPPPPPGPPRDIASKVLPGSVQIETENESVVRPPPGASLGWAFTSNVWVYPWTPAAAVQWIISSLSLILAIFVGTLAVNLFMRMSIMGPVMVVPAVWAIVLSLSYLADCLLSITVNAAYNCDKAHDWPNAEWAERGFVLLRVGFLVLVAATPAAGLAALASMAADAAVAVPVFMGIFFFLFPIVLLSSLEGDSLFSVISPQILRSLMSAAGAWIVFYLLTGLLVAGAAYFTWWLNFHSQFPAPLIEAPILAAVVFIYARLLGRLVWFILSIHLPEGGSPDKRPRRRRDRRMQQLFRGLP